MIVIECHNFLDESQHYKINWNDEIWSYNFHTFDLLKQNDEVKSQDFDFYNLPWYFIKIIGHPIRIFWWCLCFLIIWSPSMSCHCCTVYPSAMDYLLSLSLVKFLKLSNHWQSTVNIIVWSCMYVSCLLTIFYDTIYHGGGYCMSLFDLW